MNLAHVERSRRSPDDWARPPGSLRLLPLSVPRRNCEPGRQPVGLMGLFLAAALGGHAAGAGSDSGFMMSSGQSQCPRVGRVRGGLNSASHANASSPVFRLRRREATRSMHLLGTLTARFPA